MAESQDPKVDEPAEAGPSSGESAVGGFPKWLIALMVIVLAAMAWALAPFGHAPPSDKAVTQEILGLIATGLVLNHALTGIIPEGPAAIQPSGFANTTLGGTKLIQRLEEFNAISADGGSFLDAWGERISIVRVSPGQFLLTSSGADRILGTNDDLIEKWSSTYP